MRCASGRSKRSSATPNTLSRLVSDVLDTSRIVTGKMRLVLDRCAVEQVVDAAIDIIRPGADAKGVTIRMEIEPGLVVAGRSRPAAAGVLEPALERDQVHAVREGV